MNIGVAFYVGHWLGLEPGFAQLAAATAVAAVASIGSPSLPGSISFLTAIGPIAIAMGVPIAPLALLVVGAAMMFGTLGYVARMADEVTLVPLDPFYAIRFEDGDEDRSLFARGIGRLFRRLFSDRDDRK